MAGYTSVVDATPMFVPGTFDGQDVRLATIGNCQPGLFASGDFAVTQRAAGANMSVDIAAGRAYVNPAAVARQGTYLVWNGTTFNTSSNGGYTWAAADPANPRIDLLCIEVADTDFSGGYTGYKWRVVDGTPNAGATAANLRAFWPAIPTGCLVVAAIRIPAAATTITTANIYNLDTIGGPAVMSRNGIQAFAGTGTIQADGGRVVTFSGAASQTITLPAAQLGMEFEVFNIDASDNVTLSRGGTDTFKDGATTSLVIPPGGKVTVRCLASGLWYQEWPSGQLLANGFSEITAGGSGAGDKTSIAVTGDGSTPVNVEWYSGAMTTNGAAGSATGIRIRDGAGGTGTIYNLAEIHNAAANYEAPSYVKTRVAAWAGARTFYANLYTAGGTPFVVAAATSPAQLRATWV